MAREDLIPQSERTKEEQKIIARMGGIASGKARKKQKEFKERLSIALGYLNKIKSSEADSEEEKQIIKEIGYDTFIVLKEIEKGNLTAIDRFWDRLYGKPIQQVETKDTTEKKDIKELLNELKKEANDKAEDTIANREPDKIS
jgi:hypothetical protein